MEEAVEPDRAVWDAICDLHQVLHANDLRTHCGLAANPRQFMRAWSALKDGLTKCREIIQNPQPGQGLTSIWLRCIYDRAAKADASVPKWAPEWQDLVHYDDDNLLRLVTNDRESGYAIAKHLKAGRREFPDLFAPELSALQQLQAIADQWSIKWHQLKEEARARGGFPQLSEYSNASEISRAGHFLLDAVNDCEISPGGLDEELRERILRYVDTPTSLVWGSMTGVTSEGLTTLITRLTPRQAESAASPPIAPPSYKSARMFERDKWIYDSIPLFDVDTLKHKFEIQARRKKWKRVTSRTGFLKAAGKYAESQRLPRRQHFNTGLGAT